MPVNNTSNLTWGTKTATSTKQGRDNSMSMMLNWSNLKFSSDIIMIIWSRKKQTGQSIPPSRKLFFSWHFKENKLKSRTRPVQHFSVQTQPSQRYYLNLTQTHSELIVATAWYVTVCNVQFKPIQPDDVLDIIWRVLWQRGSFLLCLCKKSGSRIEQVYFKPVKLLLVTYFHASFM